jgi:MptA/FolE2 family GTP cyclohydrolase
MEAASRICELSDVQADYDSRAVPIDEVGVDRVAYPLGVLMADGTTQQTVSEAELVAALRSEVRGTHMSRFIEVLEAFHDRVDARTTLKMAKELCRRLDAASSRVALRFPLFVAREAPVSKELARMRFDCRLSSTVGAVGEAVAIGVGVPITSLCPCSKEISDYGAHSQRGRVDVDVVIANNGEALWPDELLRVIDTAASSPIYPLLKRMDERYVTMQAYDNPAFVEDVARDIVVALADDERVQSYSVVVANEESIHDHRAVARVRGGRGA